MVAAMLGLSISPGVITLGVLSGVTYGILAVGLVLVYRSGRIINFAHGEIGAFGAALTGLLVVRWSVPYWIAFALGIASGALAGAGTEVVVVRRLRRAPKLMALVATLGVAQFLLAFSSAVNGSARASATFPQPPGLPDFKIGVFRVTQAYSAMLFLGPLVVVGLAVFLNRSRLGVAMRASAANSERALMAGISAGRMSTLAWMLAGGLGAFTTVLIIPTRGFISAEALGPALLLRALAPAVVARMNSLPVAMVAGVGLGVVDQVLLVNYPTSGVPEVALLALLVGALLMQTSRGGRAQDREDWSALQPWPALAGHLARVPSIRRLGLVAAIIGFSVAVAAGVLATNSGAVTLVSIASFTVLGLSVGIVTGLTGQLSLGQFALAGVGATASYVIVEQWANFPLALGVAALAGAVASTLLGLPALRVRGLLLGVITLAFALAAQRWLLPQTWMLHIGVAPGRPVFGSVRFASTRSYYFWTLLVTILCFGLARNVWRGGLGRRLRAARDNEAALRAFGVNPTRVKLEGFAIAGLLAGVSGSLYGHLFTRISPESFDVSTSIDVVALTVLGGIGLMAGPLLGALYIIGLPQFLPLDNAGLAATSLGWLVLILYFPGGIAQVIAGPRRRLIVWLADRAGVPVDADQAEHMAGAEIATLQDAPDLVVRAQPTPEGRAGSSGPLLEAHGLTKRFGGLTAVDGVDLELHAGEILGLLGPNGAGKTTLFELLGGFTTPDFGEVTLAGRPITNLPAQDRSQLGLVRSFQDAALFPTLTVTETVMLAQERRDPTRIGPALLGLAGQDRRHRARAGELLELMGLGAFRDKQIRELSTGTRRVTELACILALEPDVLLLDEPSSGIAQRESEALGDLVRRLRDALECAIIIIEHDIPLLSTLADRMMALDAGAVLTVGSPAEVLAHPDVVESYLGGELVAIERSGPRPAVVVKAVTS